MSNQDVHVYVICHEAEDGYHGPVKVGVANDAEKRLKTLQTGNPYRLTIWKTFPIPDRDIAMHVEHAFHAVLAKQRLGGEWFDMPPAVAEMFMKENLLALWRSLDFDDEEISEFIILAEYGSLGVSKDGFVSEAKRLGYMNG